jgi:hypothetical protein
MLTQACKEAADAQDQLANYGIAPAATLAMALFLARSQPTPPKNGP